MCLLACGEYPFSVGYAVLTVRVSYGARSGGKHSDFFTLLNSGDRNSEGITSCSEYRNSRERGVLSSELLSYPELR